MKKLMKNLLAHRSDDITPVTISIDYPLRSNVDIEKFKEIASEELDMAFKRIHKRINILNIQ
jgi:hypothetical protein